MSKFKVEKGHFAAKHQRIKNGDFNYKKINLKIFFTKKVIDIEDIICYYYIYN